MKIAVTHPAPTPLTYKLVAGLQERGHKVTFYTSFYYKGLYRVWLKSLPGRLREPLEHEFRRRFCAEIDASQVRPCNSALELVRVAARRAPIPESISGAIWRVHAELFDRKVAHLIRCEDPDVVIGHDDSSLHTIRAAQRIGAHTILNQVTGHTFSAYNVFEEEKRICPEFADDLPKPMTPRTIERKRCEPLEAGWILSPSHYVRDTLLELGVPADRIAELPYGVDVDRFTTGDRRHRPFRVLFVGQISQRKGIRYLLEAFRRLALPHAELILVGSVIGSGRGLQAYRGVFTHIPHVPHDRVHRLFEGASVFAYPTLHEGSALAVFEALASGLPVITTPHSGSIVRDGEDGFIVPIRDIDALMARIRLLYFDETLVSRMGRNARNRARDFTWSRYSENLEAILRCIVGDGGQGAQGIQGFRVA